MYLPFSKEKEGEETISLFLFTSFLLFYFTIIEVRMKQATAVRRLSQLLLLLTKMFNNT
jgi:hypothetical protein